SGSFGGLTSIHVVEHLADGPLTSALHEMHRLLRPHGRALVVTPDLGGRARQLRGDQWNGFADETHINLKHHDEWRDVFSAHGFAVRREGSDGLWDPPYSSMPRYLDAIRHTMPALVQFLSGRLW